MVLPKQGAWRVGLRNVDMKPTCGSHLDRSYPAAPADPLEGRMACSDSRLTRSC